MHYGTKHPNIGYPVPQGNGPDGFAVGTQGKRGAHLEFSLKSTVLKGCKQSIQFLQGGAVGDFEGFY
jgi:hypothetical protein